MKNLEENNFLPTELISFCQSSDNSLSVNSIKMVHPENPEKKEMKPKAKVSDSQEKKMKSKAKGSEIGGKEKALLWTSVALNTITILVLAALGIYEALDY